MKLRVTVENKIYDVDVEIVEDQQGGAASAPAANPAPAPTPASAPAPAQTAAPAPAAAGDKVFPSPIAGTVRAIHVKPGDEVQPDQELMLLEAMKMETSVSAPSAGKVKAVLVNSGDSVQAGQGLVEFE